MHWKTILAQNILQAARSTQRGKYYVDACVTLKASTVPVPFAPRWVSHIVFLISLVLYMYEMWWEFKNTGPSNMYSCIYWWAKK